MLGETQVRSAWQPAVSDHSHAIRQRAGLAALAALSSPPEAQSPSRDRGTLRAATSFAAGGALIAVLGAILLMAMVKAGVSPLVAQAAQLMVTLVLNFAYNYKITWRNRPRAGLARQATWFVATRGTTQIVSWVAFADLTAAGVQYQVANIMTLGGAMIVNFITSDKLVFRAAPSPVLRAPVSRTTVVPSQGFVTDAPTGQHRRGRRHKFSFLGILAVAGILAAGWVVVQWPDARWLVYVAWMTPLVELAMLGAGQAYFRWGFQVAPPGKFTQAIIQITTTGREHARVSEIIDQIHSYRLKIDYEVWVVTEPGHLNNYPFADRVIVVPSKFTARSEKKARALEYSRLVRQLHGLDRPDVKIIFNDDDVSLTQGYIERAFAADYDICEGVVTPRTEYALRPFGHFLTSHADDIRTHACLVYCSVFQGILRRPMHVHGEGLVVTGEAEARVTWDWPVFASEDLVFGYRAVRSGLRWGWFHEYAEVTSPWSVRDFLIQRQRWLWGDIHAVRYRKVLPLTGALAITGKYMVGVMALVCSVSGLYLRLTGAIPATSPVFGFAKLSVLAWIMVFFACGWIGASSDISSLNNDSRLLSGVMAVLMMPVSLVLTFAAIAVPLIQGNPRSFKVISKTREA